jgi:hypothetical protein
MIRPSQYILKIFICFLLLPFVSGGNAQAREMEALPVVKMQTLDKITARTETFEADVGSTVKFGPLYIKIQSCQKASPLEPPESAAFLQIWEINADDKAEWIFSGWMFASSPALSHMDHPIYDVWVLDCLTEKSQVKPPAPAHDDEGEVKKENVPQQPEEAIEGLGE